MGEEKENNEEAEPNQGMLYAYMEMTQRNPLYNYYILTKCYKKEVRILVYMFSRNVAKSTKGEGV
jgi:hypothetical protein